MKTIGVVAVVAALALVPAILPEDGWARSNVSVGIGIGTPPPPVVYPAVVYPPPPPAYIYRPPVYGGVVVVPRHNYYHRPYRHWRGHHGPRDGHWRR